MDLVSDISTPKLQDRSRKKTFKYLDKQSGQFKRFGDFLWTENRLSCHGLRVLGQAPGE